MRAIKLAVAADMSPLILIRRECLSRLTSAATREGGGAEAGLLNNQGTKEQSDADLVAWLLKSSTGSRADAGLLIVNRETPEIREIKTDEF